MHFCPQEAALLAAAITGSGTIFSYIGWQLRAYFMPAPAHVHCEDADDCEKDSDSP